MEVMVLSNCRDSSTNDSSFVSFLSDYIASNAFSAKRKHRNEKSIAVFFYY
jgi:hypothetical protein